MKMYVLYEFDVAVACSFNREKLELLCENFKKSNPSYLPYPWIEEIEMKDEIFNLELT